jgi:ABC-type transport system substrate-binding protein
VTPNEIVTFDSLEVQELGFNMQNPILGTGLGTPLGMSNPSEAANASRDVREAISYAIPRLEIVQQLLNGYGVPGKTSVFCPLSEGYDPTPPPYGYYNMTQATLDLELAGYQPSSLVPSFWDAYGTFVIIIIVAVALVITVLILRKTGWMSRLRKQGAPEKSLK